VFVPFQMLDLLDPTSSISSRGNHYLDAVVRLAPGATPEQAKQATDAMFASVGREYPEQYVDVTVDVFRENEAALPPMVRSGFVAMLALMSAVVAFILLLACANVAGLLLAKATSRQREVGIRLSLGASRDQTIVVEDPIHGPKRALLDANGSPVAAQAVQTDARANQLR